MAASSVGKELDDQFLQCPICMDRFSSPKTLPKCGHVICLSCLNGIVSRNYGRLKCPIRRVDNSSAIRGSGVAGLPDSYTTVALIEYVEKMKKQEEDSYSGDPCGVCRRTGVAYCTVCDQIQCRKCRDRHMKITVTKGHKVVSIEEYRSTPADLLRPADCALHSGNLLQMYCETCQLPVCMECIHTDHQGECHKYVSLKTAAERKRERLLDLVGRANRKLPELQSAREKMGELRDARVNERSKLYTQVASKTAAIMQEVKQYEQSLLLKIQDHFAPQIDSLERKITHIDELIKHGGNITTMANEMLWSDMDAIVFFLEQQHLSQLQDIVKQKTALPTPGHPPIAFYCHASYDLRLPDNIGTIGTQAESSPKSSLALQPEGFKFTAAADPGLLQSPSPVPSLDSSQMRFKRVEVIDSYGAFHERNALKQPRGLSLSNDERQFLVAAMGNDRVLKYTIGGSYKSQMYFKTPFDLAAIKTLSSIEGNILVTDGKTLSRCNEGGETYFKEEYGQTVETLGLTTTADRNKVFLLTSTRKKSKAGSSPPQSRLQLAPVPATSQQATVAYWDLGSSKNRQELSFAGDVRFLDVNSHNQVITVDMNSCRVMVFDTDTKKLLFSFGSKGTASGQFERPLGVATDPHDNIFVCSKGRLQMFSSGGRFIGRVDSPGDKLCNPVAVRVTNKRPYKVIVTDEDSEGCGRIVIYREI